MTKICLRLVCVLFLFALLSVMIIKLLDLPLVSKPKLKTQNDLLSIHAVLSSINSETNSTFKKLLRDRPSVTETTTALQSLFMNYGFAKIWNRIESGDGWGTPYNLAWASDLPTTLAVQNENPLWIWSSGKNKKNEYGGGDDIFIRHEW